MLETKARTVSSWSHSTSSIQEKGQGVSCQVRTSVEMLVLMSPHREYFSNCAFSSRIISRLLYVEMLGHDASFGYIKAVEMAASASLYHKRTGYLVCSACLSPDHEFRFMLVNQMQRDLQSANVLEICGGLLASTALITSDMVPAMSGEVTKLLTHDSETVRKKAIITLHRFYELAPDVVTFDDLYEKGELW